jgi:hypothetical protein
MMKADLEQRQSVQTPADRSLDKIQDFGQSDTLFRVGIMSEGLAADFLNLHKQPHVGLELVDSYFNLLDRRLAGLRDVATRLYARIHHP